MCYQWRVVLKPGKKHKGGRAQGLKLNCKAGANCNAVDLNRSLSGVEAILLASAPLSQRFILPGGA